MKCRICGAEAAEWRYESMQFLCGKCHKGTPRKVNKSDFAEKYFGNEGVPVSVVNSFYEDYLTSNFSLDEYINQTCSPAR